MVNSERVPVGVAMFEKHDNPRKQGDAGMGIAISWFTRNGYTVSIPITDSQEYDLVVDDGSGCLRVSVKTTTNKRGNCYEVGLRTQGGNKTQFKVRNFDPASADLLFAACSNGDNYLIPFSAIEAKCSLGLGKKWSEYLI